MLGNNLYLSFKRFWYLSSKWYWTMLWCYMPNWSHCSGWQSEQGVFIKFWSSARTRRTINFVTLQVCLLCHHNTGCAPHCSRATAWTLTGFPQSWEVRENFVVMESHGKVMENNKNIKSRGKVKFLPNSCLKYNKRYGSFQSCVVMNFSWKIYENPNPGNGRGKSLILPWFSFKIYSWMLWFPK